MINFENKKNLIYMWGEIITAFYWTFFFFSFFVKQAIREERKIQKINVISFSHVNMKKNYRPNEEKKK